MQGFLGIWVKDMASNPDDLEKLGKRLDETQKRQAEANKPPPPGQWGIAGRFATDLVAGLFVGGGLGWGVDWLFGHFGFHTSPAFMLIFFVLGAAAGIRNIIRTAQELNAEHSASKEK